MGELLLCNQEIASIPYYIETISLNIYSLEELSYYFMQYIDLIEPGCMDEELCKWIRQELKLPSLADKLDKMVKEGGSLADFVSAILTSCNYCTLDEITRIRKKLSVFDNKNEIEGRKIRADRFLAQERYAVCIREYQKLLDMPQVLEGSSLLVGNIWHNLGTAYAGLFLFDKAKACYESAYRRNANQLSMQQAAEAERLANKEWLQEADVIENMSEQTTDILEQWQNEYRRSCR